MGSLARKVTSLVSIRWLADKLASPSLSGLRVLDGSWHMPLIKIDPSQEFRHGHIPSAQFFDIEECSDRISAWEHMLPTSEKFGKYVGDLGINNDTHVVVYDDNQKFGVFSAAHVWWMFRVFGHHKVSVLNGGLNGWVREGFEITEHTDPVEPDIFKAKPYDKTLVKSFEEMEENVDSGCSKFQIIDARAESRFDGSGHEPRDGIKPGHMPGAINIPFHAVLDFKTKTMKQPKQLKSLFESKGIDLRKPVAASCGSGVTACIVALAAYQCGKEDMAVYDGSWTEWYQRAKPEHIVVSG